MSSLYTVPIIPLNLRKEETIVQIAQVIQYLSDVTDDILKRVNSRIDSNNSELQKISERINVASGKISSLAGAKHAIQVFSSSKYPAVNTNKQYVSIFAKEEPVLIKRNKVKYKSSVVNEEPLEVLQIYHVKTRKYVNVENNTGLGEVPKDVSSINDVLLYNTGKNPYKNYVLSDTLNVSQRRKQEENISVSDIAAAPLSITERTMLNKTTGETYFYSPDLGNVPDLDVPLDLPDLPGIADDLRFVNKSDQGIAPSVVSTPNVPDLPNFVQTDEPVAIDVPLVTTPPPPPPPPVVEEVQNEVAEDEIEDEIPKIDEIEKDIVVPLEAPKLLLNNNDAHASLMEAIRKAGGLKSAKLRAAEKPQTEKQPEPTGDLMADLHAKLSMRRKGILGAKNQEGVDSAGSAMDKISAMIPPPPASSSDKTSEEEEDWEE